MATAPATAPKSRFTPPVYYPEDDGLPMAENDLQFEWIVTLKGGLDALFADQEDVYVAGDMLWYPVEGDNKTRVAPDTMVIFGRPKWVRGSYRQWEEDNIAPQVVFEVLSPGNRAGEMQRKLHFYEKFGVEEYYVLDPGEKENPERIVGLQGWRRADPGGPFVQIENTDGWRSPRLGVVFEFNPTGQFRVIRPDGRPFETFVGLSQRADAATQRADAATQRAEAANQRAEALAARLRAAGLDVDV